MNSEATKLKKQVLYVISIGTIASVACLWYVLTLYFIPELYFPSPQSVWEVMTTIGFKLFEHSFITLVRVLSGWGIGIVLGIIVGLMMTRSAVFYSIVHPLIEGVRPIPPIALIPFFILWFGLNTIGQILLIALGCFMVLAINTFVSVNNLSQIYIRAASSLGASKKDIYKTIIFPGIFPSLVSGFRIAAALAFATAVAAEFMGAQSGLGFIIMVARRTLNTNTILLGIIILGIESFALDWIIRAVSSYICRWSEQPSATIQKIGDTTVKFINNFIKQVK